jgi:hypothetical protein
MRLLQAKHIDTRAFLRTLYTESYFPGPGVVLWDFCAEYGMPQRLFLAKVRKLIKRGLVSGCDCGCRGDFALTNQGFCWLLDR